MDALLPIVNIISWTFLATGAVFLLIGGIGLLRLPDFYARTHAAGIIDTLGTGLILLGLMMQEEIGLNTFKLILIGFFLFFTSPTSSYAVAHAAWVAGQKPWTNTESGKNNTKEDGDT